MFKKFLDDYLVFSKKERLAIYLLSLITLLVWAVPYFFAKNESIEDVFKVTYLQLDSAKKMLVAQKNEYHQYSSTQHQSGKYTNTKQAYRQNTNPRYQQEQHAQPRTITTVDINKADSSQFEKLPAIGEKLSSRIVRYRERLGGFISIVQLKEVYGVSDSAFKVISTRVTIDKEFSPQKISINHVEYTQFRRHPYVSHEFVKTILAYRKQHGNFKSKVDLERVDQIDKTILEKIIPYLSFGD